MFCNVNVVCIILRDIVDMTQTDSGNEQNCPSPQDEHRPKSPQCRIQFLVNEYAPTVFINLAHVGARLQ